jgi:hypothetical protein
MDEMIADPDLRTATAALLTANARFVVIGGFAVIAHDYVRATEDIDLLIPLDADNDVALDNALTSLNARWVNGDPFGPGALGEREHARLQTDAGQIDLLREGAPPLDFESVSTGSLQADLGDGQFLVAGLESLVAFKRLAGRPRDRNDLAELEERHGPLPRVHVPGLDDVT